MAELGSAALALCLGLSLFALLGGGYAVATERRRLAAAAQRAIVASFATCAIAIGILVAAFVRHDFSFTYVAQTSSRDLERPYVVSALWGGQEGSLLLWLFLLTGYSAVVVVRARASSAALIPWVVPVLAAVQVFFSALLVVAATPFARQAAPLDGAGLNPSLQNPYMMTHPPLLYLGYVGLTVPFAFAIGALLARRTDELWIVATRRWTLVAWTFLGIGQLLGSHWAYLEIGWGGYYGWDPVENAALMPWLAATAYLHSVMIQEKRDMLRVWNVVLVILTFALTLFGTFLTRSGIVQSIHAFAQSPIGPWFVTFIVIVVGGSIVLLLSRLTLLRSRTQLESLVSREATFLYNNLLLVALTLTVLWGVLFPIVSELFRGEAQTVGPPYYNFFLRVFGLPLLLLMGIAPLVAWRRSRLRTVLRTLVWPAGIAVCAGAALVALGAGSSTAGLVAYTFSAFVLASITLEFVRGTRARKGVDGSTWAAAFSALVGRNRRRYGGYVVHAAIVLLAIGVAGSSAYQTTASQRLVRGQSMEVGPYRLTYGGIVERTTPNRREVRAQIAVFRDGRPVGTLEPGKNRYRVQAFFSNEVAIRKSWRRAEDLYLVADQFVAGGGVYLKAYVKPLVNLIWIAGFLFVAGSLIAMWPDAREQRRLEARLFGLPRAEPQRA